MAEEIRVVLKSDRHPELFKYFKETGGKPLQVLEYLLNENKAMRFSLDERQGLMDEFVQVMMKELIPMRLALRTTEKQTWMLSQLKNTEIIERNMYHPDNPYPTPKTLQVNCSSAFAQLDTTWEEYIRAKQVEYSERTKKAIEKRGTPPQNMV